MAPHQAHRMSFFERWALWPIRAYVYRRVFRLLRRVS